MSPAPTIEVIKGLSSEELSSLEQCEQRIKRGIKTFVEVGSALQQIRDGKLYREQHATFDEYCRERWSMSRIHAHRTIEAAAVMGMLPVGNTIISSERQARELLPLKHDPEAMTEAVHGAEQRAASEKRKVTANDVKESVQAVRGESVASSKTDPKLKQLPEIKRMFKTLPMDDKRAFLTWADGESPALGQRTACIEINSIVARLRRLYSKAPTDGFRHDLSRHVLEVVKKRDPEQYKGEMMGGAA
jgi:hypothetical protein